uniref:Salivary lipocalin n=1 Tax=Dipetalogaster maximus TaxID=72496 RepID=G3CJS6_DIPMA
MKTFFALTFMGIRTYVYAGSIREGKTPKPMDDFRGTKFQGGIGQGTQVANVTNPTKGRTLTTSKGGEKYIVEHPFKSGEGTLRWEATGKAKQKLTFTCKRGSTVTDTTFFIARETDYEDNPLYNLGTTVKSSGDMYDNYGVARLIQSKEIPGKLKSLTKDLGLDQCS